MVTTEGKTKYVVPIIAARFTAKDDITAGDGKKHDLLPGKAILATRTTSNVFDLLRHVGIPVAYIAQDSPDSFIGYLCEMFPLEVVVRREAHGSFLKRNPTVPKGSTFTHPVVEFYLKTKNRSYGSLSLPCDDPLLTLSYKGEVRLYEPGIPDARPCAMVRAGDIPGLGTSQRLAHLATRTFLILERAWLLLGRRLVDMKVEFGRAGADQIGEILLADVIDNDSWRLLNADGSYVDKQVYRDGGSLEEVLRNYQHIASLTDCFRQPFIRNGVREIAVPTEPVFIQRF